MLVIIEKNLSTPFPTMLYLTKKNLTQDNLSSNSLRKRRHENVDTTILNLALRSISYSTHKVKQIGREDMTLKITQHSNGRERDFEESEMSE